MFPYSSAMYIMYHEKMLSNLRVAYFYMHNNDFLQANDDQTSDISSNKISAPVQKASIS